MHGIKVHAPPLSPAADRGRENPLLMRLTAGPASISSRIELAGSRIGRTTAAAQPRSAERLRREEVEGTLLLRRELEIDRLRTAPARVGLDLETQLRAFHEFRNSRPLDGRYVDEHILSTLIGRNEAIAFGGIEELYGPLLAH